MGRVYRATLLVLYQVTLLVGLAVLPFAMIARRVGVQIPVHRALERIREKYEQTSSA